MMSKACVICALLGVVCGSALAVDLPLYSLGADQLKSRNENNSTSYAITDPAQFAANAGYGVTLDPDALAGTGVSRVKPDGAQPQPQAPQELEDTWGLLHMFFIKPGEILPGNHAIAGVPGATAWDNSSGKKDTWLAGMFWGGNDTAVTFDNPSNSTHLTIDTEKVRFEIWAVDAAVLAAEAAADGVGPLDPENLVAYLAANRTAPDVYEGWLDAATRATGVKLLTGESVEFRFAGTISPNGQSFDGSVNAYFDIDETDASGAWNVAWGSDPQLKSMLGDLPSDAYLTWDVQSDSRGWDVHSTDLGGVANVIPEPATLAMLAVGGLTVVFGRARRKR